jgi:hypothetical protein
MSVKRYSPGRRAFQAVAALGLFALAGCTQRVEQNGDVVHSYETWVPIAIGVGGLLAVPVGVLMFRKGKKFWGILVAVLGPLASVGLAPGMAEDSVTVNNEHFVSTHGFWWDRQKHDVRFDDLTSIKVFVEEKQGRRGKTYSYYFDCSYRNKPTERVPLGDLMKEALPDIAAQFREHNVNVLGAENMPQ